LPAFYIVKTERQPELLHRQLNTPHFHGDASSGRAVFGSWEPLFERVFERVRAAGKNSPATIRHHFMGTILLPE